MLKVFSDIFNTLGPAVVVPIMIFVVSVALGVQVKKSIMSGLYAGIGLTGFGWVIGSFAPAVTQLVDQMVKATGLKLEVVDMGWQMGSKLSFSTTIGLSFFVFGLLIEILLFVIGVTRVFVPSNLWNNFGYMIWGAMAYQFTQNFALSFAFMIFMLLYSLLLSETVADRWSEYYGVKNATINSIHNVESLVPAIILDPLWNLLGLHKSKLNPETLKTKLGVFGEPTMLGAILGLIMGIFGNIKSLGTLTAWGQILGFAVSLSAVMTIFPLITGVFARAFGPLAEAVEKNKKQDASAERETDKKRWFIAVDDGVGFGEPATIIAGVLLIPVMAILSFVLPGNKTLPMVDLIAIPFIIEAMIAVTKGNILKTILNGIIWLSLGLYASSFIAPYYTSAAIATKALPAGAALIASFNLTARPLNALIFFAWISGNPIFIGITIIVYLVGLFFLRTKRESIYAYLKKMADKNSGFEGSKEKIFMEQN